MPSASAIRRIGNPFRLRHNYMIKRVEDNKESFLAGDALARFLFPGCLGLCDINRKWFCRE